MQSIFIFLVWAGLIALGFYAPFVLGLGYIWVDLFRPQDVAPSIRSIPFSLIMGGLCGLVYLIADRRNPPRINTVTVLMIVWAVWITLTTTWAAIPDRAWLKWDWAVKTILFSAFMPFLFRTRVQIEAAILTIVCTIFAQTIPFAVKTMIAGSGYDRALGVLPSQVGLGESSLLAVASIACIPFIMFLKRHSLLMKNAGVLRLLYFVGPVLAVVGAFATFARAGIVSCGVWAAYTWWHSKHKISLAVAFWLSGMLLIPLMGDAWVARMETVSKPEDESSAFTRLLVWQWTIEYALQNPLGGGFDVYLINSRTVFRPDGSTFTIEARAFHSLYFEVLGEHGIVGAVIFLLLLLAFYIKLMRLAKKTKRMPGFEWLHDLSRAVLIAATAYFAGASSGMARLRGMNRKQIPFWALTRP